MWSAVSLIVLVQVYLLGAVLEAGPVGHHSPTSHLLKRSINRATRPDYTSNTTGVGAHKLFAQLATWNTARRTCEQDGAHLVIINSVAEAEAVGRLVNASNTEECHIGMHDLYQEDEFVTIHDVPLALVGYSVWKAGEPNDLGANEDCVTITRYAQLNDVWCSYRLCFVCELRDV